METDARAPYHVPLGHCSKDTAHVPVDTSDTKSRWSLLSGVYARGSKRSNQSALEMCNLWTPHSNLEKDNSLKTTPVLALVWAVWSIHN